MREVQFGQNPASRLIAELAVEMVEGATALAAGCGHEANDISIAATAFIQGLILSRQQQGAAARLLARFQAEAGGPQPEDWARAVARRVKALPDPTPST